MKINKIVFEDGTEKAFSPLPLEHFQRQGRGFAEYSFRNQLSKWEEKEILPNLTIDLEDYAKDEYGLVEEEDFDASDLTDKQIKEEFIDRFGEPVTGLQYSNIQTEALLSRFITVVNSGNPAEIEAALSELEQKYRLA